MWTVISTARLQNDPIPAYFRQKDAYLNRIKSVLLWLSSGEVSPSIFLLPSSAVVLEFLIQARWPSGSEQKIHTTWVEPREKANRFGYSGRIEPLNCIGTCLKSRLCSWLVIAWLSYLPQAMYTSQIPQISSCLHNTSIFPQEKEDPMIYPRFIPDQLQLPSQPPQRRCRLIQID